jgi:hypothetical protein
MRGIYDIRPSDGFRRHDVYITRFMKIVTGVQAILRLCPRNLGGCNVGITDGSNYEIRRSDDFMWYDILTKFHEDWHRDLINVEVISEKLGRLKCWYY